MLRSWKIRRRTVGLGFLVLLVHLALIPALSATGLGPHWGAVAWLMAMPVLGVASGGLASSGWRGRRLIGRQVLLLAANVLGLVLAGLFWFEGGLLQDVGALVAFSLAFVLGGWAVMRLSLRLLRRPEFVGVMLTTGVSVVILLPYLSSSLLASLEPEAQRVVLRWMLGLNPSLAVLADVAAVDPLLGFTRAYMEKFTLVSDLPHQGFVTQSWQWLVGALGLLGLEAALMLRRILRSRRVGRQSPALTPAVGTSSKP